MSFLGLFKKEKKLKIEFCEKNLNRFLAEHEETEFSSFLNRKNIEYKEYHCQSKCEECKASPYAIVNGDFVKAENMSELLQNLKKRE